jgi:hypothetical protein
VAINGGPDAAQILSRSEHVEEADGRRRGEARRERTIIVANEGPGRDGVTIGLWRILGADAVNDGNG